MTLTARAEWHTLLREVCPDVVPGDVTTCIVAAHPDDEIIGAGATILPQASRCVVVHVTDGAPADLADARAAGFATRDAYAAARCAEARRALALARDDARMIELGIEDQRASHGLATLALRLAGLFETLRTPVVLTHAYEGGHPDHDATAFGVNAAREHLRRAGAMLPVVEFTSYHSHDGRTVRSDFLPHSGAGPTLSFVLTPRERELKRQMFHCFDTQADVLRAFPVEVERFRRAPPYDFTRAPHAGTLHYERYPWGMTGEAWRRLAVDAQTALAARPAQGCQDADGAAP